MKKLLLTLFVMGGLFAMTASLSYDKSQQDPDDCLDSVEVPKRFTPDDDGEDDFLAINFPCPPEKFDFTVFNQEGVVVFTTKNHMFGWAGFDTEGVRCESGVYLWELNYTYRLRIVERKGQILILS